MTRRRSTKAATRIGASLFLGGAAVTVGGLLLPHAADLNIAAYAVMAAAQAIVGAVLLAFGTQLRRWVPGVVVVGGIGAVTGCTIFNGEGTGGEPMLNELFYVWPALYVGFFFPVRQMLASLALVAVAYAGVLDAQGIDSDAAVTRWLVVVSVVCGAAGAMHGIRRHVDGLVGRLREAARTDPLTGLLNRRGFEERFAVERLRAERSGTPLA